MLRFELEWIDVFILLGRIFGVLNSSIGPPPEPFRMFLYIRMIRRALIGQIQGNIDAHFFCDSYKPAKFIKRTQFRMNRLVSPLLRTDGPWASRLARRRFARVVFAFAVLVADGMNRRKVEDVETHLCNFGKHAFAVLECATRSRKHFIPGTEASADRID